MLPLFAGWVCNLGRTKKIVIQYFANRECFWKKCSKRCGYKTKTLFQLCMPKSSTFWATKDVFPVFIAWYMHERVLGESCNYYAVIYLYILQRRGNYRQLINWSWSTKINSFDIKLNIRIKRKNWFSWIPSGSFETHNEIIHHHCFLFS